MKQPTDGWPELTYAYVKHYFWGPQDLTHTKLSREKAERNGKRIEAVDRNLRAQEIPLNFLFNVLLRIAPASFRRKCLEPFGIDLSDPGLASLVLKTPEDVASIQPDVQLESDESRVFIELKVEASLGREQIDKYVARHEYLNRDPSTARRPYVLLLVNREKLRIKGAGTFDFGAVKEIVSHLQEPYAGEVTFGVTNWRVFAESLQGELDRRAGRTEAGEMLEVLVGDFLKDLRSRPNLVLEVGRGQRG